ncbi:hypothetical protein M569_04715, partial [Genlisea aurea]
APKKTTAVDLGGGSNVLCLPRFISLRDSWKYFDYLNENIPWIRPTIRVFAKFHVQPRDTCYVASEGLPRLVYSGYQPQAYSWDEFPVLREILDLVHRELPESSFNSLLLNRYKGGDDYVGWHADDEKLYGPSPQIASLSFGCERHFLLKKKKKKKKPSERSSGREDDAKKRDDDRHSFVLKHGSLLVMGGNTQRDWLHSVPRRVKASSVRINLTFRRIV